MTDVSASELDPRTELRAYLSGTVAGGLPPKAAESILSFADAMVAAGREPLDVAGTEAEAFYGRRYVNRLRTIEETAQDLIDFYDGGGFRANFPEDHFARLRAALEPPA